MKIKIGNKIIDSNKQPMLIIFDQEEKDLIGDMSPNDFKFCMFPVGSKFPDIEEFMKTDEEDLNQLSMIIDNDVAIINTFQARD